MSADLHLHTTASDGTLTPRRVVRRAVKRGMRVISITDHDTTSGLAEALQEARRWSVHIIPGIEINTDHAGSEAHLLGYFIDVANAPLQEALATIRDAREHRIQHILDRLREAGVELDETDVVRHGKGESIGRPHVAMALVQRGHASSVGDAFERWLAKDRPGYVPRESLTPAQAIQLILQAGGVPVLAHPIYLGGEEVIAGLVEAGLRGIEVFYPQHQQVHRDRYEEIAKRYGLVVTGGSDFHGPQVKKAEIGDGRFTLARLRAMCEQAGRDVPLLARTAPQLA